MTTTQTKPTNPIDPDDVLDGLMAVARNALDLVEEQEQQIRALTQMRANLRRALAEVDAATA